MAAMVGDMLKILLLKKLSSGIVAISNRGFCKNKTGDG